MTECNKCGQCCEVIPLKYLKKDLYNNPHPDAQWILKHFRRISKVEARKRNSAWSGKGIYYECDQYNWDSRECMPQDLKPDMCKKFPWYDKEPSAEFLIPFKKCSFWEDIPKNERPEWYENL